MVAVEKPVKRKRRSKTRFNITGWWCIPLSMMEPAREELEAAIEATTFATLVAHIKMSQQQRFLHQKRLRKPDYTLTAPVKWTQSTANDC
jgi:hypothetical protein